MALSKYTNQEVDLLRADLEATQAELKRRQQELRKETDEKLLLQAKHIERLIESRLAVGVSSTQISYEVLNFEGDLRTVRIYEALRTGAGLELSFFEHRAKSSTPGAKFGEAQLIPARTSPGITMDVRQEDNTRFFKVNFPAHLTSTAAGANYAFEYTMTKGVLMTMEAASEAYRNDPRPREALYQINEISTGSLRLDVTFPPKYPAKWNCLALINDIIHTEETERLIVTKTERSVSLSVEKPLPGFEYMIEWDAPSEEDLGRLKNETSAK